MNSNPIVLSKSPLTKDEWRIFLGLEACLMRKLSEGDPFVTHLEVIQECFQKNQTLGRILFPDGQIEASIQEHQMDDWAFTALLHPGHLSLLRDFYLLNGRSKGNQTFELEQISSELTQDLHYFMHERPDTGHYFNQIFNQLTDPKEGVDFSLMPEPMGTFLRSFLEQYFDKIGAPIRGNIIAGDLLLAMNATGQERLLQALLHGGPILQKEIQLIANESSKPAMRLLLDSFKLDNQKLTKDELNQLVTETFGDTNGAHFPFLQIEFRPVAVATIAQVHRAILKQPAQSAQVVIKLKRPDLQKKAAIETIFMHELVKNIRLPKGEQIIAAIEQAFNRELDFQRELENMELGKIYQDERSGIQTVEAADWTSNYPNALIMKEALGRHILADEEDPEVLEVMHQYFEIILRKWLKEVLFKSGFFHADLHAGNMLLDYDPQNKKKVLTLLDFGSCARLSQKQQIGLVGLLIATQLKSVYQVVHSLHELTHLTDAQKRNLEASIKQVLTQNQPTADKVNGVFQAASREGVDLPEELILFNRGLLLLEQQLKGSLAQKTLNEATEKIYSEVILNGILMEWPVKLKAKFFWYAATKR